LLPAAAVRRAAWLPFGGLLWAARCCWLLLPPARAARSSTAEHGEY